MDKVTVKWRWDRETSGILLKGLYEIVQDAARLSDGNSVLDLGGQTGGLARRTGLPRKVCIDIIPKEKYDDVCYVKGDIRALPFDDGEFDLVLAKAVLHHVPDDLGNTLKEVRRVMKQGGYLVVEEPLANNPISSVAGKFFTTSIHDEDERPLDHGELMDALKAKFDILEVKPFFLTTYLMPHLIPRSPEKLRSSLRELTKLMQSLDETLFGRCECLSSKGSYLAVMCRKS